MKCSTIQRDNFNRRRAVTTIAANIQNGVVFYKHKCGDVVFIGQSPHQQLSAMH